MKNNLRVYVLALFVLAAHIAAVIFPAGLTEARTATHTSKPEMPEGPVLTGTVRVYDGDSIFFGKIEVRLDAIDAPEHDQACRDKKGNFWPCGIVARDALRKLVGMGEIKCVLSGKDKYRRLLGNCYAHHRELNAAMVESGNAIAYHYFSEKYADQESQARDRHKGIWQDAEFTEPYYCRHFEQGHTCYEYDYMAQTGRVAESPLIGKSHATGAPE